MSDNLYSEYHKIKIYPTEEQKSYIDYCINCARFVYNWAVYEETVQYENFKNKLTDKQFLSEKDLRKKYTELVKLNPWLSEFQIEPARYVISRVDFAFDMFFKHLCERPTFKKKKDKHVKDAYSFRIRHDRFYIDKSNVRIPGFKRGRTIDCKYDTDYRFKDNTMYHQVSVYRDNLGDYFVCFMIEKEKPIHIEVEDSKTLGIDVNLRRDRRMVCSDGTMYAATDTTSIEKRIRKIQTKYGRDLQNLKETEKTNPDAQLSNRAKKNILKFRKANRKLANVNMNDIHQMTSSIIKKGPKCIVMETLNIRNDMSRHPYMEKQRHYIPLFRIKEVMEYKCKLHSIKFISADMNFKSTQTCSRCGAIKKMSSQKIYICPKCGLRIDRDLNSAINLEKLAYC